MAKPEDPDLEPAPVTSPLPPEVLFTLPLNGERGISLDTSFRIQFSEDMDPESFGGNILLLCPSKGSLPLDFRFAYDSASLTLTVTPSARLEPEQEIRPVLNQGILSEDGIALLPAYISRRAARAAGGEQRAAAVLTFYTGKR